MPDIAHQYGNDLALGPGGDLAAADGTALGQQRVLRRLLTNPGDYLWNPAYGAGLAAHVGRPAAPAAIRAAIRGQLLQEAAVAASPPPVVDVQAAPDGTVAAQVRYADSTGGPAQVLRFSVGEV